jgi:hypothetical protein
MQQDDKGATTTLLLMNMEIVPFQINAGSYDHHLRDDGMDLFLATQSLEPRIRNLQFQGVVGTCLLRKV